MQYRYIELYVDGSGQGFLIRCNGYQLFKICFGLISFLTQKNRFEEEYQLAGVCFLFSGFSGVFLGVFFGIRLTTDRFKEEFLDCV